MKKHFIISVILISGICLFNISFAQNVGVGTATPHSSAILDIQSTNKGASLPTMTTAQRKAIATPKVGLLVFDIDKNTVFMYDGAQWQALLFSASQGALPPIERSASDGASSDFFGSSVSISGNYAVVGAPNADIEGDLNRGAAYVFFRDGSVWTQQAKLISSDGEPGDGFGLSVGISGDYIIVGAHAHNSLALDAGSAYIFFRSGSTWTQQEQIFAPMQGAGDRFGYSVGISGDYAIIGAPLDDIAANPDQGSAHFFVRSGTNWTAQDHVIGPLTEASTQFGFSVAIQGDNAIIGAPYDDVGGNNDQGSAHVFIRIGTDWSHQATLTATNGDANDSFGESVSIYGDVAVAGAPAYGSDADNEDMGAVYLYRRTGTNWSSGNFIFLPLHNVENAINDRFGGSVCITADYLLIGAIGVDISPYETRGSTYLFRRDNNLWRFARTIIDANASGNDQLGSAVAIDGFNCIMGASGVQNNKGKILFLNVE
jgi:hypothetical protein